MESSITESMDVRS